jgi:hypothetical protein
LAEIPPVIHSEHLLHALKHCGDRLDVWLSQSQANARLFLEDPVAALHAANPGMDRDVMLELETVLRGLARKLNMTVSERQTSAHAS